MFRYKDYSVPAIEAEVDNNGNVINPSIVDQFDAQPFMMGENGFHRHPMSIIVKEEESDLRNMLLERLQEQSLQKGFDDSVPVSDIVQQIIPRRVQTAASLRDFVGTMNKGTIADFVNSLKPKDEVKEVVKDSSDVKEIKTE